MAGKEGEEVKLLKTWSSLFGLRVVWALKLKGIPYESFDEDLSNKSDELLNRNPVHKKVPVLIHNGRSISESLVVLEYIDETWSQNPPALLPQDPLQRAAARFWAKFGDEKVLPSMWKALTKEGKQHEEGLAETSENLKLLEQELKGKKFFRGEEIGIADIALGWVVNLVPVYQEILGEKLLDEEHHPNLLEWMHRISEVPVIDESWPSRDRLVTKWTDIRHRFLAAAKEAV
ncbi:Probable glutathione S-transferase [Linum grandiflorum]